MSTRRRRLAAAVSGAALALSGPVAAALPAAGVAPTSGTSPSAISPTSAVSATPAAARPHPPLAAGQKFVSVAVPGGLQSAVYDQHGHLWFWKMPRTTHRWARIGASSYPMLAPLSGTHVFGATGVLLSGMGKAVFILNGYFTGDGDADWLAFGTGPKGWGRLAPRGNTLVPTGKGSTDNRTPGLALHIQAFHGLLETSQAPDVVSVAQAGLLPVNRYYRWSGGRFDLVRDNILTAGAGAVPSGTGSRQVANCPATLADGSYVAGENAVSLKPRRPFRINNGVAVTVRLFDTADRACAFTVPAAFPISIPMTTTSHGVRWITAPIWLLTTSGSLGDPWGDAQGTSSFPFVSGVGAFQPRGVAPYFIPKTLKVTAFAPATPDSPVASAAVQVTIRRGRLVALAVFRSDVPRA